MTPAGWFLLISSISLVVGLFLWCVYKIVSTPEEYEHIHGFEGNPEKGGDN